MELPSDKRPQSVKEWLKQLALQPVKSKMSKKKGVDWTKWGTVIAAFGLVVAILAMIPTWLALNKPDEKSPQPLANPSASVLPKE